MTQVYAFFKKFILGPKIQTVYKRRKEKGYSVQIVPQSSREGYTDIRKNRLYIEKGNKRQRKTLYINKKGSIWQENITIINIYAPNDRPGKCVQ